MTAAIRLSKHFTFAELTCTSSSKPNLPNRVEIGRLRTVCEKILEPVRENFKSPVIIHSGFRSLAVNSAVGGSKTSQHLRGEAVDFHVQGFTVVAVAVWIRDNLDYDQLILEHFMPGIQTSGWVHCSYAQRNRGESLTKFKGSSHYLPKLQIRPGERI